MFPPRKIERKKDQIKSKVSRIKEIKIKAKNSQWNWKEKSNRENEEKNKTKQKLVLWKGQQNW